MAKKEKRPLWFKMFRSQKALIDGVSNEVAGKALKAIFSYFENQEPPEDLDPTAFAVFCAIKPYVDEAYRDYEEAVKNGKAGAGKRWPDSPPMAPLPEEEAEIDADS